MKPFFSIIIPTLNEQKFLPKLLKDLKNQSYQNFEILVVDGQSHDKTLEKASYFASTTNLKTFNQSSPGVSNQRNFGAKQAKGEYLIFFDADNRIPKTFLSTLNKQIKNQPGYLYTTKLATNSQLETQIVLVELSNFIIQILNTLGKPFAPGCNIIIEKDLFKKLKGFNPNLKLAEDHDLVQRARKLGVLLTVLKSPVLYVSFRRPEKFGYLRFITQYTISGLYTLTGTPITKDPYDYPLGGQIYNQKNQRSVASKFLFLKKNWEKLLKNIELPF